jgi:peptide chain release factor 1
MDTQIQAFQTEYDTLTTELSQPDAYADPHIAKKTKRQGELKVILDTHAELTQAQEQLAQASTLAQESSGEMAELANAEVTELESKISTLQEKLTDLLAPKDPNDDKDVIIEIRAGAGGDEASLFAGDLFRMYTRYCEQNDMKTELASESPSDAGGFKEVIFTVRGAAPYSIFKYESGVHRVQRVPVTESQGRIHTSTATVAVMPEAEDTDITIDQNDLKIDTYRASGHGGQSVNTTDSAVRITHVPTGITVSMQDEKSQIKNRDKAMKILRSRLMAYELEKQRAAESAERKSQIGTGDRSEKIRTYNIPQDRITDHRIGYSRSNVSGAFDGAISDLIEELTAAERNLGRPS